MSPIFCLLLVNILLNFYSGCLHFPKLEELPEELKNLPREQCSFQGTVRVMSSLLISIYNIFMDLLARLIEEGNSLGRFLGDSASRRCINGGRGNKRKTNKTFTSKILRNVHRRVSRLRYGYPVRHYLPFR